jgi:hypothetical protein
MSNNISRTELLKEIKSLSIDKSELKRILDFLQVKATEASKIEIDYIQNLNLPKEKLNVEKAVEDVTNCSLIKITIKGIKGEDLFGSIEEVFDDNIFPSRIKSVYVNSKVPYVSQFNYAPRNYLELFLDFTKPKIFDFSIQPSEKTPNNSFFKVEGYEATWVNGVFSELDRFFLNKPITFIHKSSAYDIIVWLIGIPFAFWFCNLLSRPIQNVFEKKTFLSDAFFIYGFIVSLLAVRILFHYFRWVFPMVTFKNKNDKAARHQALLYAITVGMFGKFLYDLFKWVLNI